MGISSLSFLTLSSATKEKDDAWSIQRRQSSKENKLSMVYAKIRDFYADEQITPSKSEWEERRCHANCFKEETA